MQSLTTQPTQRKPTVPYAVPNDTTDPKKTNGVIVKFAILKVKKYIYHWKLVIFPKIKSPIFSNTNFGIQSKPLFLPWTFSKNVVKNRGEPNGILPGKLNGKFD
jgi:hypothetical protein